MNGREPSGHADLNALWEATRPVAPEGAWNEVWSRVERRAAGPRTLALTSASPRSGRGRLVALALLAQAAAVLLAVWLWPRSPSRPGPGEIGPKSLAVVSGDPIDAETAMVTIWKIDGHSSRVERQDPEAVGFSDHDLFGEFEGRNTQDRAMRDRNTL